LSMNVEFTGNETADVTAYRYDYGQQLVIKGLALQNGFEVHYESGTESPEIRKGTVDENSVGTVAVPDITLQLPYDSVKAWIYVKTPDSGTTVSTLNIHIIKREKPPDSPSVEDYPQIKAYADYVKENAEKVTYAEAAADKIKADAAAGLFNGADGPPGPPGIQGPPGQDGAPGKNGKDGVQMYIATTEEELGAVLEEAMAAFAVGYALSIITTDAVMNGSGHSDDDLLQLYVLDSGTGNPDDALILASHIVDGDLYAFVKGIKPEKYGEYIKSYPMLDDFSADLSQQKVSKVRMIVKPDNLVLNGTGSHAIALKLNKYTFSVFETDASVYDLGYLDIEAETLDSQFILVHARLYDLGGSLLKETQLFTAAAVPNRYITNIGLQFKGFSTSGKTYRMVYMAGGN